MTLYLCNTPTTTPTWTCRFVFCTHRCAGVFFTSGNRSYRTGSGYTDTGELVNRTGKTGYRPVNSVGHSGKKNCSPVVLPIEVEYISF
jgi:hypothetical protein